MAWPVTSCDVLWPGGWLRWRPGGYPVFEWHHSWNDHFECRNVWRHVIPDLWTQQIYIYNIWHMYWVSLKSEKIFIAISAAQIWVATSTIKKTTSGPPSANFWDEPATSHRFLSSFHLVPSAERRAEGSLTGGCRAMSRCPEAKLYATHMRRRANIRWIS